jgi:hypothetical protein
VSGIKRTPGGVLSLVLAVISAASCSNNPSTPTPTPTPTRSSPATENFTSNLTVQGSAWRYINAIAAGTVTATLTTTDQPSTVVGLGIGLRSSGSGCLVTREVIAPAGSSPRIDATVDAGAYCIKIFDTGTLTTPMNFTVSITYP